MFKIDCFKQVCVVRFLPKGKFCLDGIRRPNESFPLKVPHAYKNSREKKEYNKGVLLDFKNGFDGIISTFVFSYSVQLGVT